MAEYPVATPAPAPSPADLARCTTIAPVAGLQGSYRANLSPAWNYDTPSGGVLMTLALRALVTEFQHGDGSTTGRLLSATAIFCGALAEGEQDAKVTILRRGDTISQATAALSPSGVSAPSLIVTAVLGRDREGTDDQAEAPALPNPLSSPDARDGVAGNPHERFAFFDNFDVRIAEGPRWWVPGWSKGGAGYARWFRYRVPQTMRMGEVDPLALPPIIDTMTAALNAAVGPPLAPYVAPSLSLTINFHRSTTSPWLLVRSRALSMSRGYASVAGEVWSETGELVATATQTMVPLSVGSR